MPGDHSRRHQKPLPNGAASYPSQPQHRRPPGSQNQPSRQQPALPADHPESAAATPPGQYLAPTESAADQRPKSPDPAPPEPPILTTQTPHPDRLTPANRSPHTTPKISWTPRRNRQLNPSAHRPKCGIRRPRRSRFQTPSTTLSIGHHHPDKRSRPGPQIPARTPSPTPNHARISDVHQARQDTQISPSRHKGQPPSLAVNARPKPRTSPPASARQITSSAPPSDPSNQKSPGRQPEPLTLPDSAPQGPPTVALHRRQQYAPTLPVSPANYHYGLAGRPRPSFTDQRISEPYLRRQRDVQHRAHARRCAHTFLGRTSHFYPTPAA